MQCSLSPIVFCWFSCSGAPQSIPEARNQPVVVITKTQTREDDENSKPQLFRLFW
eukprot:m.47184 g.47184  ORF g.47184 m.47184 type:complete len:55 (-) comp20439_c0_seq1:710-874(-)